MGIRGNLHTMSLPELLEWIEQRKKTGVLQLQRAKVAKDVFFEGGSIVSSGSNDPREYLGEFFISFGKLSEEDLVKAYHIQKETKVYLGKILVMIGKATEAQVQKVIAHKTRETILDCFLWDDGNFAFVDREAMLGTSQVEVAVGVGEILSEGAKRKQEWAVIRQAIPSSEVRLKTDSKRFPPGFPERQDEKKLIEFIDQGKKIPEICLEFHMGEFMVTKKIHQMVQQGVVTVGDADKKTAEAKKGPSIDQLLQDAEKEAASKNLSRAVELYAQVLERDPTHEKANERYQAIRDSLIDNLKGSLKEEKVPNLIVNVDKIDFARYDVQEGYVLSRINGSWSVEEIIQICPFPQEKVLSSLKRFLGEKIISL